MKHETVTRWLLGIILLFCCTLGAKELAQWALRSVDESATRYEQRINVIEESGREAARLGISAAGNPHRYNDERTAWYRGFVEAKKAERKLPQ